LRRSSPKRAGGAGARPTLASAVLVSRPWSKKFPWPDCAWAFSACARFSLSLTHGSAGGAYGTALGGGAPLALGAVEGAAFAPAAAACLAIHAALASASAAEGCASAPTKPTDARFPPLSAGGGATGGKRGASTAIAG